FPLPYVFFRPSKLTQEISVNFVISSHIKPFLCSLEFVKGAQLMISDVIRPKHYLQFVLKYLEMDGDLSVSRSRSRLPWGIQVPGDDSQTIYVWLDALVNYLAVVKYPSEMTTWPPSWQILGKDILNVGNVVDPYEAMDSYTAEGLRYFLLKQGLPHGDSNNALAVFFLLYAYPSCFSESIFLPLCCSHFNIHLFPENTALLYDDLYFYKAIEGILAVVKSANGLFQLAQPWKLPAGPKLDSVLYLSYETVRVAALLLMPIVPSLADHALTRLRIPLDERRVETAVFTTVNGGHHLGPDNGPLLLRISERKAANAHG
ncbi:unnamed protein product, partial [Cylicostephanus goldi]